MIEEKNTNKEIEDILNENPLIKPTQSNTIKSSKKKFKLPKKKTMIVIGITTIIIVVLFMMVPNVCQECTCDVPNNTEYVNSIKQQIIEKGYANVEEMTLSPYIN